jgi:hypothetical protein
MIYRPTDAEAYALEALVDFAPDNVKAQGFVSTVRELEESARDIRAYPEQPPSRILTATLSLIYDDTRETYRQIAQLAAELRVS